MNIFYRFTWRSLKKNKVRTVVTVFGIILAVSLITATMTSVSTLYRYIQRVMADENGSWHLYLDKLTNGQLAEIKQDNRMEEGVVLHNIGYAQLEKNYVAGKPYLYICGYESGDIEKLCNLVVMEGRMPENSSEIMLPQDLEEYGGIRYGVGETVTWDLGVRRSGDGIDNNAEIWEYSSYIGEGCESGETWEKTGTKTYTVVGKYRCGMFGAAYRAGFAGITKADADMQAQSIAFYATVKDTSWVTKKNFSDEFYKSHAHWGEDFMVDVNRACLNITEDMTFELKVTIGGMIVILLFIIGFGSIALIYNSFSISISERKRQYGLLSSIGATKRQLKKCMLFEAVVLSVVGIPFGVLLGLGGISAALYFLRDVLNQFLAAGTANPVTIEFFASAASIVIAAVIGFFTVLLSAWIPAGKALKMSAVEAIRQNDEIRLNPKKLRISRVTEKIAGVEGALAIKNFRRNKRKYRATIVSLAVSIVLFVSTVSFCDYLGKSVGFSVDHYDSDLDYWLDNREDLDKIYEMLHEVEGVKKTSRIVESRAVLSVKNDCLTGEAIEQFGAAEGEDEACEVSCNMFFIADEDYQAYLEENGYQKKTFMSPENPVAVVYNSCIDYDSGRKNYVVFDIIESENVSAELFDKKQEKKQTIRLGEICGEVPFGTKAYLGNGLLLFYPMSALPLYEPMLLDEDDSQAVYAAIAFAADNPDECALRMKKILEAREENMHNLHNNYKDQQTTIAFMTVIKLFSNGFVLLIFLIALANVFNTIATNIMLRRREFAMLRSMGMTRKGFKRMMNYECLICGGRGILYGIPIAILITYGIYQMIKQSILMNFYMPWYAVVIAVGSVAAVVLITMMYSLWQLGRDNVADDLKTDIF